MNGKKGDDPILDLTYWRIPRYSPTIDSLIIDILRFGGEKELKQTFDLFTPPPPEAFEEMLKSMRDRLWNVAKDGGWEV